MSLKPCAEERYTSLTRFPSSWRGLIALVASKRYTRRTAINSRPGRSEEHL